jgi:hypothetical protein
VTESTAEADHRRVAELLGREPLGAYTIVVRDRTGDPVVIENAPLLDDGTPMPTGHWLVGHRAVLAVSRLEADGGVDEAEASVDAAALAATHAEYSRRRDALIPSGANGPLPSGGVAGTRTGVKCLHAHYAWHLAGGDDPVGRWVHDRLTSRLGIRVEIDAHETRLTAEHPIDPAAVAIPVGAENGWNDHLATSASSAGRVNPADLTNLIGLVTDAVDEFALLNPDRVSTGRPLAREGPNSVLLARLETGDEAATTVDLDRATVEELFRLLATDDRAGRASNPGLRENEADSVLAVTCITAALTRTLDPSGCSIGAAR